MMNLHRFIVLLSILIFCFSITFAQDSTDISPLSDTLSAPDIKESLRSAETAVSDTVPSSASAVTDSVADSVVTAVDPVGADSVKSDTVNVVMVDGRTRNIVKRNFDPQQQVVIGTTIMVFIIIIMTTVGNWNP